jgi:surface carbohydrate biosynthesis protein (TIGR04326 family)
MHTINWTIPRSIHDQVSILEYIEKDSKSYREVYVSLINKITNYSFDKKPFSSYLRYNEYQNLWPMAIPFEKSHYKSKHISELIKIIAFDDYLAKNKPKEITLIGSDRNTLKTLYKICDSRGIKLVSKRILETVKKNKLYRIFPKSIQATFWIIKMFIKNISLNSSKINNNFSIFICSYFSHLKNPDCKNGIYNSGIWGVLPEFLKSKNINVNWLHHYIKSSVTPDCSKAQQIIDKINQNESSKHNIITGYLNIRVLIKIIFGYAKLRIKTIKIRTLPVELFHYKSIDFKKYLIEDFENSIFGISAIENIMWIELFNEILKSIPTQNLGIYLQENQGWEYAFINAWKFHGHKKLIAIQHSSVAFWDLRFYNPFTENNIQNLGIQKPDLFSVNGELSKKQFLDFGYKEKEIINLEALRYADLITKKSKLEEDTNIVVLGDISNSNTLKMLDCIYPILNDNYNWKFKPHPANHIKIDKKYESDIRIIDEPIEEILSNNTTIISTSLTTSSIESLLMGLKTIIFQTPGELNRSPLKDEQSVRFVSSEKEIQLAIKMPRPKIYNQNFFYYSKDLNKWGKLICSA